MNRRGFTLLETALAAVIAAMVLLVASGLLVAMGHAEKSFARANERTNELAMTQGAVRRAFLRLVMASNATAAREGETDTRRPRLMLTTDPVAGADGVPRFEVVVSRAPIAQTLAGPAASWAFADEDRASLNFVSADGTGGQVRGVFELRRDGEREQIMRTLGIANPMWDAPEQGEAARDGVQGWTLWWRRMPAEEIAELDAGNPLRRDGDGDQQLEAKRLAGSVRLIRGLDRAEWNVFKNDEWTDAYGAIVVNDLPAFLKLKMHTLDGEFAEWLFEVEWTTSDTVSSDAAANALRGLDAAGNPVETGSQNDSDSSSSDDGDQSTGGQDNGSSGSNGHTAGDGQWGDSSSGGKSATINIGGKKDR